MGMYSGINKGQAYNDRLDQRAFNNDLRLQGLDLRRQQLDASNQLVKDNRDYNRTRNAELDNIRRQGFDLRQRKALELDQEKKKKKAEGAVRKLVDMLESGVPPETAVPIYNADSLFKISGAHKNANGHYVLQPIEKTGKPSIVANQTWNKWQGINDAARKDKIRSRLQKSYDNKVKAVEEGKKYVLELGAKKIGSKSKALELEKGDKYKNIEGYKDIAQEATAFTGTLATNLKRANEKVRMNILEADALKKQIDSFDAGISQQRTQQPDAPPQIESGSSGVKGMTAQDYINKYKKGR